ncbi:MAG: hypothetical protein FWF60_08235, partial [Oscillospiraceae bacterium]|nr:hypothetical protein [Oscillospiraceae bacterium]
MKKNLFLRAAAMLTVFAMFSLCTIPRTLSKFSESPAISGKSVRAGIFRVAVLKSSGPPETWVTVGETGTGGSLTIDLFQGDLMEAYLDGGGENIAASKDGDGKETVGPAGSAAHILTQPGLSSPADSTAIIAPGCGGE